MQLEAIDSQISQAQTIQPGQNVQWPTNNGTPMVLTLTNDSNANVAGYAVFATIGGTQWSDTGNIEATGQRSYIKDFQGNPVTIFNTTNTNKAANIDAKLVGTT